jgi:hypothetical protein
MAAIFTSIPNIMLRSHSDVTFPIVPGIWLGRAAIP